MKIRSLAITGFGPYASRQELDFEHSLDGASMFVISGNTGAGKTTIFDAISYALYGEASGTERDGSSLRSDFADASVPTEVELFFSLRGRNYRIKRSPAYERAKLKGSGTTKKDAEAELEMPDGKIRTGAKDVTLEIESVVGLTADQFRQLVMIPQGEFRRLLGADASQKEDIFRKIFGTEVFGRIQTIAKERARKIVEESAQIRRDRRNAIDHFIPGEDNAELKTLIASEDPDINKLMEAFNCELQNDKNNGKKAEDNLSVKNSVIEKISNEITLGEKANQKIDEYAVKKSGLEILTVKQPDYTAKERMAVKARRALSVNAHEMKYLEKIKELEAIVSAISISDQKIIQLGEQFTEAEKIFGIQKARESERAATVQRVKELEALRQKVAGFCRAGDDISSLEKTVMSISERITFLDGHIVKGEISVKECNDALDVIAKQKESKNELEIEAKELSRKVSVISTLLDSIDKCVAKQKKHDAGTARFAEAEAQYLKSKAEFERLDTVFRKSQAGLLASELEDGAPCPVCGSLSHPRKAAAPDLAVSAEIVKNSRDAYDKAREERDKILSDLMSILSVKESLYTNSIVPAATDLYLKVSPDSIIDLRNEARQCGSETEKLIREKGLLIQALSAAVAKEHAIQSARETHDKSIELYRAEMAVKQKELTAKSGELGSARAAFESLEKEFKDTARKPDELDREINKLKIALTSIQVDYDAAEKKCADARSTLDTERGNNASLKERNTLAAKEREEALNTYTKSVTASGFADENDYRANCIPEDEIKRMENEAADFKIMLEKARVLCDALAVETKNLSRVDLVGLGVRLENDKSERESLNRELQNIKIRISINEKIINDCTRFGSLLEKADAGYETIGFLAKFINGDNSRKISFERYVLAAYFEDIIAAANVRLGRMTGSRYELMRKRETGDKRKALGLEMEVFDNYTGRARDVSTLSGGESFKASLCLALGMADVVQSHAGGIQLDTMFIDEGFGTLDPESLDNAIECLVELKNGGRLVGIISHVPELKERIGARLEVISTSKGSMAEFRV